MLEEESERAVNYHRVSAQAVLPSTFERRLLPFDAAARFFFHTGVLFGRAALNGIWLSGSPSTCE
jgi:hypothetical protein